jgi:hypothetical protein
MTNAVNGVMADGYYGCSPEQVAAWERKTRCESPTLLVHVYHENMHEAGREYFIDFPGVVNTRALSTNPVMGEDGVVAAIKAVVNACDMAGGIIVLVFSNASESLLADMGRALHEARLRYQLARDAGTWCDHAPQKRSVLPGGLPCWEFPEL